MVDPPELLVPDADRWRSWLETHHATSSGVRLVLARRLCLTTFAECKRLGRFVLRYHGATVAAGQVLKITR